MGRKNKDLDHIKQEDLLFFDELTREGKKRIEQHLKACYICAEKVKEVVQIQNRLKNMKTLEHLENELLTRYVIFKSSVDADTKQPTLTTEEIDSIEKHLKECPLCQVEYHILAKEYAELGTYFDTIPVAEGELVSERPAPVKSKNKIKKSRGRLLKKYLPKSAVLKFAAGLAVLVMSLLGFYSLIKSPGNQFASLAQIKAPVYVPVVLRDRKNMATDEIYFEEGMKFYQQEDYDKAINQLRQAVNVNPEHDYAQFYLGVSYLLNSNPERAIDHLQKAVSIKESPLLEKSTWYLGKAYLRVGDANKALEAFTRVVDFEGAYLRKSERIIIQIEQLLKEVNTKD